MGGSNDGVTGHCREAPKHQLHLQGFSHSLVTRVLKGETRKASGIIVPCVTFTLIAGFHLHTCLHCARFPEAELFCAALKNAFYY